MANHSLLQSHSPPPRPPLSFPQKPITICPKTHNPIKLVRGDNDIKNDLSLKKGIREIGRGSLSVSPLLDPLFFPASLTVRITVKSGDPSGAGKNWEN